jgi:DNA repair protein RadC
MENGKDKPHYSGHRRRLRERYRRTGGDPIEDYELLELLLTYAIPRKDVKPVAKALLVRFKSLAGVMDATIEELEKAEGIGPASSTLIPLIRDICSRYLSKGLEQRESLASPKAVVDFARMRLGGLANEVFMVIFLDSKNRLTRHEVLHEGSIDHAVIYPRIIVKKAFDARASGLIFVHNHPSGDCSPSAEDRKITDDLLAVAKSMDIRILDHIVVGREGHFSFAEQGLLARPASPGSRTDGRVITAELRGKRT